MTFFSQKDSLWKYKTLGDTPYTVERYGCLVCSLAMVLGTNPYEVLAHKELYDSDGVIKSYQQVADTFGSQLLNEIPDPVIIRTLFDGSLHFVVRYQGRIYDPLSLDGHALRDYKITSYVKLKPLLGGESSNMAWYSIKGAVFHDDVYVGNPSDVLWPEVVALNPQGYQIIDDDELRALQSRPVEVIKEVIVPDATTVTALNKCNTDFKNYKETHPDIQPEPEKPVEPIVKSSWWSSVVKWWNEVILKDKERK